MVWLNLLLTILLAVRRCNPFPTLTIALIPSEVKASISSDNQGRHPDSLPGLQGFPGYLYDLMENPMVPVQLMNLQAG